MKNSTRRGDNLLRIERSIEEVGGFDQTIKVRKRKAFEK